MKIKKINRTKKIVPQFLLLFFLLIAVFLAYKTMKFSSSDNRSDASVEDNTNQVTTLTWPPSFSPKPKPKCTTNIDECPYDELRDKPACDTIQSGGKTLYCPRITKVLTCKAETYKIPTSISLDNLKISDLSNYKTAPNLQYYTTLPGDRWVIHLKIANKTVNPILSDLHARFVMNNNDDPYSIKSVSTYCSDVLQKINQNNSIICKREKLSLPDKNTVDSDIFEVIDVVKSNDRQINNGSKQFAITFNTIYDGVTDKCDAIYFKMSK